MNCVSKIPNVVWDANGEVGMVGMAVITISCAAGVAFYVRFLVALCKECKHRWIGYFVRINSDEGGYPVGEPREPDEAFHQAA